jgi:hypothetical protein
MAPLDNVPKHGCVTLMSLYALLKAAVNNAGRGNRIVMSHAVLRASRYHRPIDWLGSINVLYASNVMSSGRVENLSRLTGTTVDGGVRQLLSRSDRVPDASGRGNGVNSVPTQFTAVLGRHSFGLRMLIDVQNLDATATITTKRNDNRAIVVICNV